MRNYTKIIQYLQYYYLPLSSCTFQMWSIAQSNTTKVTPNISLSMPNTSLTSTPTHQSPGGLQVESLVLLLYSKTP